MGKRRKDSQNKEFKPEGVKPVTAKTPNQKEYLLDIVDYDVVVCCGPAGSGKSFIAAGMASDYLAKGKVDQIVVVRPLVASGEDVGALPGSIIEKMEPYLRPIKDHLKHFLGRNNYGQYINSNQISFEPLEMMRGRTFDKSFILLDEAENCTLDQIKMLLTRMGQDSKVVINGDIEQSDIGFKSGLETAMNRLQSVECVAIAELDEDDILRNGNIRDILDALRG